MREAIDAGDLLRTEMATRAVARLRDSQSRTAAHVDSLASIRERVRAAGRARAVAGALSTLHATVTETHEACDLGEATAMLSEIKTAESATEAFLKATAPTEVVTPDAALDILMTAAPTVARTAVARSETTAV